MLRLRETLIVHPAKAARIQPLKILNLRRGILPDKANRAPILTRNAVLPHGCTLTLLWASRHPGRGGLEKGAIFRRRTEKVSRLSETR